MHESRKTNAIRDEKFKQRYFGKTVLDIGSGNDLVVSHATGFDMEDGDANKIDEYIKDEKFNCVHSSHCLEHMHNPKDAIKRWWSLVEPNGYMIIIVPDEDLYEQTIWPSMFNKDHKATFCLDKEHKSWSPVSYDIRKLAKDLNNVEIISAKRQDNNYNLIKLNSNNMWVSFLNIARLKLYNNLQKKNLLNMGLLQELNKFFFDLGGVVDQTVGPALAQIEIILQKK